MCVCVCVACAFGNKSLDSLATLLTSVPCHSFWWRRLSAPHYFHGGKSPRRNALTSLGSFSAELLILKLLLQCAFFYLIYRNIFMLLRQRETWKSSMVQYLPRAHHNFSKKYPHWKVLSSCRQFFDMSTSFVIPITQCKQLRHEQI